MKRLLLSLVVLIFVFNMAGMQWLLIYQQRFHQEKTWSEKKNNENLLKISNEDEGFCRVNEHEIIYHGKLYDIKDKQVIGNKVIYSCAEDRDEERLITSLDGLIKDNVSSASSANSKVLKIFKTAIQDYLSISSFHFSQFDSDKLISFLPKLFEIPNPFIAFPLMPPEQA